MTTTKKQLRGVALRTHGDSQRKAEGIGYNIDGMSVSNSNQLPKNQLRTTHYAPLLLLAVVVLFISLIVSGRFDPQPLGTMQWSQEPVTASQVFSEPEIVWLARPLPPPPYTIRLTAAWQGGHPDSAYGLALGRQDDYLLTAVTPTGYLLPPTPNPQSLFPILPWPHVNQLDAVNEIWLDVTAESVTIRINGELYSQERLTVPPGHIGLWGMSWGETAVVDFQRVELFYTPATLDEVPAYLLQPVPGLPGAPIDNEAKALEVGLFYYAYRIAHPEPPDEADLIAALDRIEVQWFESNRAEQIDAYGSFGISVPEPEGPVWRITIAGELEVGMIGMGSPPGARYDGVTYVFLAENGRLLSMRAGEMIEP
jgi:hypothetical protein